jgi:hypothetical protein
MEKDMESDFLKMVGGLVIFLGILFGALCYTSTLRNDCKLSAIEKGYAAVEIQAICGLSN